MQAYAACTSPVAVILAKVDLAQLLAGSQPIPKVFYRRQLRRVASPRHSTTDRLGLGHIAGCMVLVLFCNRHMTVSQASRLGAHDVSVYQCECSLFIWHTVQHPHSVFCKMPSSHCTGSSTCQALTLLHMLAARGPRRRLLAKRLLLLLLGDVGATLEAAGVRALLTARFLRAGSCAKICTKSITPSGTLLSDEYNLAR